MKKCDVLWALGYSMLFSSVAAIALMGKLTIWNKEFPYLGGFIQFMIFASSGEILSTRILYGKWEVNKCAISKAIMWGVGGLFVTIAFKVVSGGVELAMKEEMLPFYGSHLAKAFFISCSVNLFFAPIHSAAMRIFSNYFEEKYLYNRKMTVYESVTSVEWGEFVEFSFFKTIPFFWIPVNTLIFLLPEYLRVAFAAMLSLVFGMLMTLLKHNEKMKSERII